MYKGSTYFFDSFLTAVAEECGEFILATLDLSQVFQCDLYPDTDDPTKCVNWARGI
jgi:hypothetical protein